MNAEPLLDSLRCLVVVVLGDGTIDQVRGGFGGFLDLDVASLPGTNVFDHVVATDAEELAQYFIENAEESEETIALPLPFRMSVMDGDGFVQPVDIIPTGQMISEDDWSWTVLLTPASLNGSITRSFDLEMAGVSREVVRAMLCEELRVDNSNYTSRWLLIDLDDPGSPDVLVARPEDQFIADIVAADLDSERWRPWEGVPSGATPSLDLDSFPGRTRSLMDEQGWRRSIVAPVYVHDRLAAIFLLVGKVPSTFDPLKVTRNVAARVQNLVRATAMLIERWGDQDRLRLAASTDELTGLMNRRALFASLETERRTGSLLYVDVDDFKFVNDRFGHTVGDQILVEVARRIESACRSEDSIARVGGDEFVVVLPGADDVLAHKIARRIIDRVAETLHFELGPLDITVSVGHALLESSAAIDAADHAMLRAKRSGRGLVAASDPV